MKAFRLSRAVLQYRGLSTRQFSTQVPSSQSGQSESKSVPNISAAVPDRSGNDADDTPVHMLSFYQRLTRTQHDRQVLRTVLVRMAQLLAVSVVFNGAYMFGALDPVIKYLNPTPTPDAALELEDQQLVDRISAMTMPSFEERMAAAPRHLPSEAAPAPAAGVRYAGEPFTGNSPRPPRS